MAQQQIQLSLLMIRKTLIGQIAPSSSLFFFVCFGYVIESVQFI